MKSAAGEQQGWDLVKFAQYGIHPERGFLPSPDPLDRLPEAFDAWERSEERRVGKECRL